MMFMLRCRCAADCGPMASQPARKSASERAPSEISAAKTYWPYARAFTQTRTHARCGSTRLYILMFLSRPPVSRLAQSNSLVYVSHAAARASGASPRVFTTDCNPMHMLLSCTTRATCVCAVCVRVHSRRSTWLVGYVQSRRPARLTFITWPCRRRRRGGQNVNITHHTTRARTCCTCWHMHRAHAHTHATLDSTQSRAHNGRKQSRLYGWAPHAHRRAPALGVCVCVCAQSGCTQCTTHTTTAQHRAHFAGLGRRRLYIHEAFNL